MTLEERVSRLEQRAEVMDRLEQAMVGLRSDFNTFRGEQGAILERILATLAEQGAIQGHILATLAEQGAIQGRMLASLERIEQRPPFRWPWERP